MNMTMIQRICFDPFIAVCLQFESQCGLKPWWNWDYNKITDFLVSSFNIFNHTVKSPLKVSVVGGVTRRKGWGTNITFDALTESYDPDYPEEKSGFR